MKNRAGFTLVELLIVMAIAAILAVIAVPSFWTFIQNQRATTQANNLVTAVNLARSEAARRGSDVQICASTDQQNCDSTDWTSGWIARDADADEVLRVWGPLPATGNLNEGGTAGTIVFNGRGEADGSYAFTLWFDGCAGEQTRSIRINLAGRPSVTRSNAECD